MTEAQKQNEQPGKSAEKKSPEQVYYDSFADSQMKDNDDFENKLENQTYKPKSLSNFISTITTAFGSSWEEKSTSPWLLWMV